MSEAKHPEARLNAELLALCRSKPELERLLKRLAKIAPIVQQQVNEAEHEAERAYFEDSGKATPEAAALWRDLQIIDGFDLCAVQYRQTLDTPEWREFHSIGLAVAAFGGADAIEQIGWMVGGSTVWNEWDGMAGFWL
jgi:hypothetical protein